MAVKSKYALSFGFVISYPEDHPNHGNGVKDFLMKKYPNEKDVIDQYFDEQRLTYNDDTEGFYAQGGTTSDGTKVSPIGSTDVEVEKWVSEDYEDFRDNRSLNEWTKRQWQRRAGILK